MFTQNDCSGGGLSRLTSILRPFCWENLCIRASVSSTISAMAGISTRVSVQRTEIGFFRFGSGMERTALKISDASIVLSFPPLNPTSHGRLSSEYS
jgi:hypothetical protein